METVTADVTPEAFARMYDDHYPRVFRYLLARTHSAQEAEELTAEVFALALAGLKRRSPLHIGSWLIGIADHVASRFWRTRSAVEPAVLPERPEEDPEELVLGKLDSQLVWQCVDALSAEHRHVLLLRVVAGLSAREVGTIMGKTEQAIRSLQWRALAALRRQWMEAQAHGRVPPRAGRS